MSRKATVVLGFAVWLYACSAFANDTAVDIADLTTKTKPSVVDLRIFDHAGREIGNGSGFFVRSQGWVVTNAHVIEPAHAMKAVLSDGRKRQVLGSLAVDERHDLAIVLIEGDGYPPLPLADPNSIREGMHVLAIGSPLGLSWTISEGIVAALRSDGLPAHLVQGGRVSAGPLIQITAPMSPGSSGSPIFNEQGEVLGIAVMASVQGAQNVNFAVPVDALTTLLGTISAQSKPQAFTSPPWINLAISAFVVVAIGTGWMLSGRLRRRR